MVIAIVICRQSHVVIAMLNTCWDLGGFTGDRRIYHGKFPVERLAVLRVGIVQRGRGRGINTW